MYLLVYKGVSMLTGRVGDVNQSKAHIRAQRLLLMTLTLTVKRGQCGPSRKAEGHSLIHRGISVYDIQLSLLYGVQGRNLHLSDRR